METCKTTRAHGARIWRQGDICCITFPAGILTPDQMEDVLLASLCKEVPTLFLYDLRKAQSPPLTSLPLYATCLQRTAPRLTKLAKASIFVVENELVKIFVNALFCVQKPVKPVHVTDTMEQAFLLMHSTEDKSQDEQNDEPGDQPEDPGVV